MNSLISLDALAVGSCALVSRVTAVGRIRRRLLDIGLVPGTKVEVLRRSPAGDPTAFEVRGGIIALRQEDSQKVIVSKI